MTNKSKAKGTTYESSLLPLLQKYYPGSERRTLSGANDKGDFITPGLPASVEAKCQRTMKLGEWLKEAIVEAKNLGVPFAIVIHKRYGTTDPAKQFVTMEAGDFFELLKLIKEQ